MVWDRVNKTVLITGASRGIGAATARRLGKAGAQVILVARRKDIIDTLAAEIGNGATAHALDIADRAAVEAFAQEINAPDVLINCAGLARGRDPLDTLSLDDIDEVIATNINGVFYVTRVFLPAMRARNSGHIVNVSSMAAFCPYPGAGAYAASKAAVRMFSQCLRNDLGGTRIRVTDIAPGMVHNTEFAETRYRGDQTRIDANYRGMQPLEPEDIAETICFSLAAPEHVNVDLMVVYPLAQHAGPAVTHREPA